MGVLRLAWNYVAYHKGRSLILVCCLALVAVLPLTSKALIRIYGRSLTGRADATPLVLGARGDRFDLVLKSLYFNAGEVGHVSMAEVDDLWDAGGGMPLPLHLRYTARGYPLVGCSIEYYEFRGLSVQGGTLPLKLGQAVVGADVAAELAIGPGDAIFSDQANMYDISRSYPLKMHVVGVLARRDSPDDRAVFVDVKTAWIIDGVSHGHQDLRVIDDPSVVLDKADDNITANASLFEYNEVTDENISSFHVHGDSADLPVSAVIFVPDDAKSATMTKARFSEHARLQMLVPSEVVNELLGVVFRVQRFFDANFVLVSVSTGLFLVLIVMLSVRVRRREIETLYRIGCSRATVAGMLAAELGIVVLFSAVLTGALAAAAIAFAPHLQALL